MVTPLAKVVWWDCLANERTLVNRDGALMACLRFWGPDLHSALDSALVVQAEHLNNCFKRFEGGWGILTEARRREVQHYPISTWRHPAARLVDEERRDRFLTPKLHYQTESTLTLTWQRPRASRQAWKRLLYTNLPREQDAAGVPQFEEQVRRTLALLSEACEEVTQLEESALLTYLHSTVSWKDYEVAVPDPACYLNTYLTDTDVLVSVRGTLVPALLYPQLGHRHLRCVSVLAYPHQTDPGLLDVLDTLALEYRATVRYLPLSRAAAIKAAQTAGDAYWGQRHRRKNTRVEKASMTRADDASTFQEGIDLGHWSAGHLTQTVVVWDETVDGVRNKAEIIEATLNNAGYRAKVERANTLAAWDATLPGNTYTNRSTTILTTQNLAHLIPAKQHARGPAWNKHLNGPPLLYVTGRGSTPVALDLYEDDVGHTMIIGPTGTGKSTLLALLCMQWLKYAGAQVYALDKDQSLRCATYAVGGDWYDIGAEMSRDLHMGGSLDELMWKPLWIPPPGWWQCYEMASILETPGIIPQVMGPLLRQMEERLMGSPTLISLDEGWVWLKREFFAGKIQDYLLTLRKKNGVVIFSTPSLKHLIESPLGTDIYESCVTKIFLANPQALTPEVGKRYRDLGLTERQCYLIATLVRKRQYFVLGPHGQYVCELGLGPITLAYTGAGSKAELAAIDMIYHRNPAGFAHNWLLHRGLPEAAARLERGWDDEDEDVHRWTPGPAAVA